MFCHDITKLQLSVRLGKSKKPFRERNPIPVLLFVFRREPTESTVSGGVAVASRNTIMTCERFDEAADGINSKPRERHNSF